MIDVAQIEEAEVGILSCMLQDSTTVEQISEQVEPADMLLPEHQSAMRIVVDFHRAGGNTQDVKTVAGLFRKAGILEALGGVGGMKAWSEVLVHNLPFFLSTIRDAVRIRRISKMSTGLSDMLYRNEKPKRMVEYIEESLRGLSLQGDIAFDSLETGIQQVMDTIKSKKKETIDSGVAEIDSILGPVTGGELIVIAARPSVGKSALAVHMALQVAQAGNPVLMVSLEMRTVDLVSRILTQQTSVSMTEIRSTCVDDRGMREIEQAKADRDLAAVGMAVPGHIEGDLVRWAPNFGATIDGEFHCYRDVDLASPIRDARPGTTGSPGFGLPRIGWRCGYTPMCEGSPGAMSRWTCPPNSPRSSSPGWRRSVTDWFG